MKTRRLGRSGLQVSEVSFGSWLTLGNVVDFDATAELVQHAYDLGIQFFDTADVYAAGEAEAALGNALREIPRPRVVLATKCYFPMSEHPNDGGLSRKHIFESVEASLTRLRTDYIDLHQCHRADANTPLEETVRAYEDLIRQGKVLYWGISEWRPAQVIDACRIADATGGYRPISSQPQYSIMRRQLEAEMLAMCVREGLGQIAFSPLGQGVLTGKYSGGQRPADSRASDDRVNHWMGAYLEPEQVAKVDQLEPIAADLGLSMAQLALAWCLREPGVSSVIVGATRKEQLEDNCRASGLTLPDDAVARIEAIFPGPKRRTIST